MPDTQRTSGADRTVVSPVRSPCRLGRQLILPLLTTALLLILGFTLIALYSADLGSAAARMALAPVALGNAVVQVMIPTIVLLAVVYWRLVGPLRRLLYCAESGRRDAFPQTKGGAVGALAGALGDLHRQLDQTTEELEQHRSWCQLLFDDAPDAILLIDPDNSRVIDANAAAARLLVRAHAQLTSLSLHDLCPADPVALTRFMDRVRRDGSGWSADICCMSGSGDVVDLEAKAALVDRTGHSVVLAVLRPLTDTVAAEARLANLAYHDVLTGLPNRVLLRDRLDIAVLRASRDHVRGAVLVLDIDNFKTVNDALGHSSGDHLLQELAGRAVKALAPDDTIARLGGDEFMVLPRKTDAQASIVMEDALAAVEQLQSVLDRPFVMDGHEFHVTLSVGIALYPQDGANFDELLRRADSAMYQAKAAGRNTVRFYAPELEEGVSRRLSMNAALRHALAEEQFTLHFQPKLDLADARLVGCEALARWARPGTGLVPPIEFLPYLEEIGLLTEFGFWVLDRACQHWRDGRAAGHLDADFRMAVNISAGQFASPAFVQMVLSVLQDNAMPGCNLELEITEQALVNDLTHAATKITALQAHGVTFAIDDFGTGYSSLAYLQQLPVDCLKIDRGFVTLIGHDDRNAGLVDVIISIARKLNLRVVAEGVEHATQLAYLTHQGCDIGQGYLFGRPVPWDELMDQTSMASRGTVESDFVD